MSAPGLALFLSAVTSELGPYRAAVKAALVGPRIAIKEQADFINCGKDTLAMLDEYIHTCTGVIHLMGDATGDGPAPENVQALLKRYDDLAEKVPVLRDALANGPPLSYTQWEAYLALYHGKHLFLFQAAADAARGPNYAQNADQKASQDLHRRRLQSINRYGKEFANEGRLCTLVLQEMVNHSLGQYLPSTEIKLWSGRLALLLLAACTAMSCISIALQALLGLNPGAGTQKEVLRPNKASVKEKEPPKDGVRISQKAEKASAVTKEQRLAVAREMARDLFSWKFKTNGPIHASPVVHEGVVCVHNLSGFIYAIDILSGRELWRYRTGLITIYSFDLRPSAENGVIYFATRLGLDGGKLDAPYLYGVDVRTGKEKWKFKAKGEEIAALSVVKGTAYYTTRADIIAKEPDWRLCAVQIDNGQEKWEFCPGDKRLDLQAVAHDLGIVPGDIRAPDMVFVAGDDRVYVLSSSKGDVGYRCLGKGVVVQNGMTVFSDLDKQLFGDRIDNASFDPHSAWKWRLNIEQIYAEKRSPPQIYEGGHMRSLPALGDNTVFFGVVDSRGKGYLQAWCPWQGDAAAARRWTFEIGEHEEIHGQPVIADGCVYFVTNRGHIFAVSLETGKPEWTHDFKPDRQTSFERPKEWELSPVTVVNNVVYFGTRDGYCYAVSR